MNSYVFPNIRKYDSFDSLKKNASVPYGYLYRDEDKLTMEQLTNLNNLLILAEPGIGKTRLLREVAIQLDTLGNRVVFIDLKKVEDVNLIRFIETHSDELFMEFPLQNEIENAPLLKSNGFELVNSKSIIVCLDALDEVRSSNKASIANAIKKLIIKYPEVKVIITCRINFFNQIRSVLSDLAFSYINIQAFSRKQVVSYLKIKGFEEGVIDKILTRFNISNRELIIQTPRYLEMLINIFRNPGKVGSFEGSKAELFEEFTYGKLQEETKKRETFSQKAELIKRILEKIALIMEIQQSNIITREDLITFFDDAKSNLSVGFFNQVDIQQLFERTLLRDNFDGTIQFENTEIQEYLAAKEITRLGRVEQVVYDLAVEQELEEIYPSWFNTIKFLIGLQPSIILSLWRLFQGKTKQFQDSEFHKLFTVPDVESLPTESKSDIFLGILRYYQANKIVIDLDLAEGILFLYNQWIRNEIVKTAKSEVITKINLVRVAGYISEQFPYETEFWKDIVMSFSDIDDVLLQRSIIFTLGQMRDIASIKQYAMPLLAKNNKLIDQDIIAVCTRYAPNDEFSIMCYIEGTKRDHVSARYGFYAASDKVSCLILLNRLIEDSVFREKFVDAESIFKDQDEKIIQNIVQNWDDSISTAVRKLLAQVLISKDVWDVDSSKIIESLAKQLKEKDTDCIFKVLNEIITCAKEKWYYWPRILSLLLDENQVEKFVSTLSGEEETESLAFRTLISSPNLYEHGRKYFSSDYRKMEKQIKTKKNGDVDSGQAIYNKFLFKLEPEKGKYATDIFSYYSRNKEIIKNQISEEESKRLVYLVNDLLTHFDPEETLLKIEHRDGSGTKYTTSSYISVFRDCLQLLVDLSINAQPYHNKIISYIPFAYAEDLELIYQLIPQINETEIKSLMRVYTEKRSDDLARFAPRSFISAAQNYKILGATTILKQFVENRDLSFFERQEAFDVIGRLQPDSEYFKMIFSKYESDDLKIAELADAVLIEKYNNYSAFSWRLKEISNRVFSFIESEGVHRVGPEESELRDKDFAKPLINLKDPIYENDFLDLVRKGFSVYSRGNQYHAYARYMWDIAFAYYNNLKETRSYSYLVKLMKMIEESYGNHEAFPVLSYRIQALKNDYLQYMPKNQSFSSCIKTYNRLKENQYLDITNSRELYELVKSVVDEDLRRWIEDEGAYHFVQDWTGKQEDLIQKTIKTQIENYLLRRGLRKPEVRREEQLLDDDRPDMLITYGFVGPVLIEIKRVDRPEVFNDVKREAYRDEKLLKYMKGTRSDYGFFLIFQIYNTHSLRTYVPKIKETYKDCSNISILDFNCMIKKAITRKTKK